MKIMKNQCIVLARIFARNVRAVVERERYWLVGYVFVSSLVFFLLSLSTPPVVWDSEGYFDLANDLAAKGMNFIAYDFNVRTFVHPLYLALIIQLAEKLPLTTQLVIHLTNILLYHFGVMLVWNRLRALDPWVGRAFLCLSAINVIVMSFAFTYLTENLATFFTTVLLYLLTNHRLTRRSYLGYGFIGFFSVLYVYTRPSALTLFVFLFVFVVYRAVRARSFLLIIAFLAGSAVVFSVGIINVYINDKRLGLFTSSTSGIYNMQIRNGPELMKYETSVDSNYPLPTMHYVNSKNIIFRQIPCNDAGHCAVTFISREPLRYFNSFVLHLFNMFDRTYLDIYVDRIMVRDTWLALANYVVIASVLVYWLFFPVRPHFRSLLLAIGVIVFGSIVVYLPTVVEPRFSTPLYPLLLIIFAIFMREVFHNRSRVLLIKTAISIIVLVVGMYTISDLVDLQLWNGLSPVYPWKP